MNLQKKGRVDLGLIESLCSLLLCRLAPGMMGGSGSSRQDSIRSGYDADLDHGRGSSAMAAQPGQVSQHGGLVNRVTIQ